MEQITIRFSVSKRKTINVHTIAVCKYRQLNQWLDRKSIFYSRIAEFSVTRRMVLRVNLVTFCFLLSAFTIEQHPLVAVFSAFSAAWLIYRFNQSKKKGARK